jgi:hypothetical protein
MAAEVAATPAVAAIPAAEVAVTLAVEAVDTPAVAEATGAIVRVRDVATCRLASSKLL